MTSIEYPRIDVDTARADQAGALVKVSGDIDRSTVAELWTVLTDHLAAGRRFLRLDLSGVTGLDSAALGGLKRIHDEALRERGTLVITGVRSIVARVFRVTGLDQQLFIGGPRSEDDALKWLSLQTPPSPAGA